MTNKPQHEHEQDQPGRPEGPPPPSRSREELNRAEVATRGERPEWRPDEKDTDPVKLTTPQGTKITTSRAAAEELRGKDYQ